MSAADYDPLYEAVSATADALDEAYRAWQSADSCMNAAAVALCEVVVVGGETAWDVQQYKRRRAEVAEASEAYQIARAARAAAYEAWQAAGCPVSVGKPTRPVPAVTP